MRVDTGGREEAGRGEAFGDVICCCVGVVGEGGGGVDGKE